MVEQLEAILLDLVVCDLEEGLYLLETGRACHRSQDLRIVREIHQTVQGAFLLLKRVACSQTADNRENRALTDLLSCCFAESGAFVAIGAGSRRARLFF